MKKLEQVAMRAKKVPLQTKSDKCHANHVHQDFSVKSFRSSQSAPGAHQGVSNHHLSRDRRLVLGNANFARWDIIKRNRGQVRVTIVVRGLFPQRVQ
jgi:hypothetical protein